MITEEKFRAYEDVRLSGITNMFNITLVCELTNLKKEEVKDIMKNYKKYYDRFLKNG